MAISAEWSCTWGDPSLIWWWLLIVVLFAAVFALTPVRVELSYTHFDDATESALNDVLDIRVRALYFVRYARRVTWENTGLRTERLSGNTVRNLLEYAWRAIGDFLEEFLLIRRLLSAFEIRDMTWNTTIGTASAPDTAVLCGMIWTVQSALVGAVSQIFTVVRVPRMSVTPRFDKPVLSSNASCIVATRLGKATYAGWRLFLLVRGHVKKSGTDSSVTAAKEGVHAGSSDSITYADSHGKP